MRPTISVSPTWRTNRRSLCDLNRRGVDVASRLDPGLRTRRIRPLAVLLTFSLFLSCQTTLSVEEAKKVTASFGTSPRVLPPRTINDIVAILERDSGESVEAGRLRAIADASPPASASTGELAGFYLERGKAAKWLGRANQEHEDLLKAADNLHRSLGVPLSVSREIVNELAWAELRYGNYRRAIELMKENLGGFSNWSLSAYSALARMYAWAGDVDSAKAAMRQAQGLVQAGQGGEWAPVLSAITEAVVLDASGRWQESERYTQQAIGAFRNARLESRYLTWIESQQVMLVRTLAAQGRLTEAEVEARDILKSLLSKNGRDSAATAAGVGSLADVLVAQGRYVEAERLAKIALEIYDKVGAGRASWVAGGARQRIGRILTWQGKWSEAVQQFEHARAEMATNSFIYEASAAGIDLPIALIKSGRAQEALALLLVAIERRKARLGEEHYWVAEARGILAIGLAAIGRKADALSTCQAVSPLLLSGSRHSEDVGETIPARTQRLTMILETCISLLDELRGYRHGEGAGIDVAGEAFRLAEVARSGTVQGAVRAAAARAAVREAALADLVRREQDASQQVRALYSSLGTMLSLPPDQQDQGVVRKLRSQVEVLKEARSALGREIEKKFPDYSELVAPKQPTVEQARAQLRPGEALIVTYVASDRTYVWAIPPDGAVEFISVPLGQKALEGIVTKLRQALDPSARTLGGIPEFDLRLGHELYVALLEPVKGAWQQAESLLIVAHGPLGRLPFSLLPTSPVVLGPERTPLFANYHAVPWLVRTHAVTMLPSVGSLIAVRTMPAGDASRRAFIGFGDPYFSPEQAARAAQQSASLSGAVQTTGATPTTTAMLIDLRSSPRLRGFDSSRLAMLPRLPDTAEEIKSLAVTMRADPSTEVFLGGRANEQAVKKANLSRYRVVAFATHGLVPGDLDGLTQPALALSHPEVAKVEGDGLLTMDEILGLRLDADWVVLSACNTASGNGSGSEAVSGLGRAFFYAGARALLVSNWQVETTSARALTTDIFRRQQANAALTRAKALQQTMNMLIDEGVLTDPTGKVIFSYAHPIFWAPFTLVGDGGR